MDWEESRNTWLKLPEKIKAQILEDGLFESAAAPSLSTRLSKHLPK